MKYENRGNEIIKIENGVEYIMVACKVNGMDSFVWEENKTEDKAAKFLTCVNQPDSERDTFTRYSKYEIIRETACFWWVMPNSQYQFPRKIRKRTMREAGFNKTYAAEFDIA